MPMDFGLGDLLGSKRKRKRSDGPGVDLGMVDSGMMRDFAENPAGLRDPGQIRMTLRKQGVDTFDVNDEASYEYAEAALRNEVTDGDRDPRSYDQLEAEHDLIVMEGRQKYGKKFTFEDFPDRP